MAQNAAEQLAELTVRLMEWKETDKVVLLPLQTVLESAGTLRYISLNLQGIHTINQPTRKPLVSKHCIRLSEVPRERNEVSLPLPAHRPA